MSRASDIRYGRQGGRLVADSTPTGTPGVPAWWNKPAGGEAVRVWCACDARFVPFWWVSRCDIGQPCHACGYPLTPWPEGPDDDKEVS